MIPLATKLFGSQLCTGRQARPQPYGARALYSRTTLLDALFGLPRQLKFFSSRHGCSLAASLSPCSSFSISSLLSTSARSTFQLSFSLLSLSFSSFPHSLSFDFPLLRLFVASLGARRDTRGQLKVPARPGRLHDP